VTLVATGETAAHIAYVSGLLLLISALKLHQVWQQRPRRAKVDAPGRGPNDVGEA
jgi:hypothetical protein